MTATLRPIGQIRTPYRTLSECPRNADPDGPTCQLAIHPAFAEGLTGLNAGDYVLVLYWLDRADRDALLQTRGSGDDQRGVFALRSPHRPNPIGAAVSRIERIADGCIDVRGLDCLDGTPLLDIKPAIFAAPDGGRRTAPAG